MLLFTTASRQTTSGVNGCQGLSLELKRPEHEADRSPPSNAEVKNAWSYTSTPPIHLHGAVLS
jgi:hypothetical protein